MQKLALSLVLLVGFTIYTALVATGHGLLGFITEVAMAGGWSTQVFLDLIFALLGFYVLAVPDAKRRGISAWPFLVASILLGSIGMLAYFVYRELRASKA